MPNPETKKTVKAEEVKQDEVKKEEVKKEETAAAVNDKNKRQPS